MPYILNVLTKYDESAVIFSNAVHIFRTLIWKTCPLFGQIVITCLKCSRTSFSLLSYCEKMCWGQEGICVGVQLWKSSKYSSNPSMPGFCICKHCIRFGICQSNAPWQGSKSYAWSMLHRVLNKTPVLNARVQNMTRLRICEGYTQGAAYAWISLNIP